MPIVIIEGPDLSGKSTAIEKLSKKLNSGFVLKNAYKPKDADSVIFYQYESIIAGVMTYLDRQPDEIVILDRFYPSEAVYSILRGYDELDSTETHNMETLCAGIGVKLIFIDTPVETLEDRYAKRGDEHIKLEQLRILKTRYDTFYDNCTLEKIRVDTTKADWLDDAIAFIKEV